MYTKKRNVFRNKITYEIKTVISESEKKIIDRKKKKEKNE